MTTVDPFKLADQGYLIFPCEASDKRPAIIGHTSKGEPIRMRWSQAMSSDPMQIQKWVSEHPGCKWGVPTGSVNGFIAVDIDSSEAEAWWESKWLPEGKEVKTPRGGTHILYEVPEGLDIQTNKSVVYKDIDIRAEGGYVVAYTDNLTAIPMIPESVIEILPERHTYEVGEAPDVEPPTDMSEGEKRVLKGITDKLDALPRPWKKGASYHDVQFRAACHLNRIANSPYYATNHDQAYKLFLDHAPLNEKHKPDAKLREERWRSAVQATKGQFAEHPGDVPVRLPAESILDKFKGSAIDKLFWDSKKIGEVKTLIHELRMGGATEQEAYSISYEAAAMKSIRKRDPKNPASTWGFVLHEYQQGASKAEAADEDWVQPVRKSSSVPVQLLSDEERTLIRDYPNFIDRYIVAAGEMFAEPNLPLHYLNAWIALSCGIGDKGRIHLAGKSVPLSLWGLPTADSAAGKGDAAGVMMSAIGGMRRGGFGDVHLGYDVTAQGLNNQLMERKGKTALVMVDEASSMLQGFKQETSYYNQLKTLALKLYDGQATRAVRSGTTKEEAGEQIDVTFNFWLQTTWDQVTNIMDLADVQSGLVGRFLVAVGDDAKITDESLALNFASEHQVTLGRHPLLESLVKPIRDWSGADGKRVHMMQDAHPDVGKRFVKARRAALSLTDGHPLASYLRGVILRVTENFYKAACLLALSEGRSKVEMEDLLLALKSGEYWLRDTMRLVEAISSSAYRRLVEAVVELVQSRPRTRAYLLSSPMLKNMKRYDAEEVLARAESEHLIQWNGKEAKWESTQRE